MKKLYIAIASASALAATSSFAAGVDNKTDGLTLDVSSKVEVAYTKNKVKDSDATLNTNNIDLNVEASYTAASGVKAFSVFKTEFLKESTSYVGIGYMDSELTVGNHALGSDNFGIGQDFDFGVGNALGTTSGTDVIKASYSNSGITLIASADIAEGDADESALDVYGSYETSGITVAATFQSQKENSKADTMTYFGVSGKYVMDAITAGAEFTYDSDSKDMAYEVAGAYAATDMVTVAAGFGQMIYDNSTMDTLSQYYVNASYKLVDNAAVYAEVGGDSDDKTDLAYTAGMYVKF
jgi:hypothetical protein